PGSLLTQMRELTESQRSSTNSTNPTSSSSTLGATSKDASERMTTTRRELAQAESLIALRSLGTVQSLLPIIWAGRKKTDATSVEELGLLTTWRQTFSVLAQIVSLAENTLSGSRSSDTDALLTSDIQSVQTLVTGLGSSYLFGNTETTGSQMSICQH